MSVYAVYQCGKTLELHAAARAAGIAVWVATERAVVRGKRETRAAIPGYIFVQCGDMEKFREWDRLRRARLLVLGGHPCYVGEDVLRDLHDRLWRDNPSAPTAANVLRKGDRVRTSEWPFLSKMAGRVERVKGNGMVRVMLDNGFPMEISARLLVVAN